MDLNALNQKFEAGASCYFAALRLPQSAEVFFFYANRAPELSKLRISEQPLDSAFLFSPYGGGDLAYRLVPDLVFKDDVCLKGNAHANVQNGKFTVEPDLHNTIATQAAYEQYVSKITQRIQNNQLDKVVAARCCEVELPATFSRAALFHRLCEQYPDACVYYFAMPGATAWMGATPEKLLEVNDSTLTTVGLAGTLPTAAQREWTQKERNEQAITADFIRQVFEQHKIKVKESDVREIVAGNVKHLYSVFTWQDKPATLAAKFHKLLGDLNPTPAVCGMPQFDAADMISREEQLERRFYSGFVGMMNGRKTSLFVNLRCMELSGNRALLYAGAGITADSNPQEEWEETHRKMQTLQALMQ